MRFTLIGLLAFAGATLPLTPARAQDAAPRTASSSWSPQPWLDDLRQMREALQTRYANRAWLEEERGVSLQALFARAAARLWAVRSDDEARRILDRIVERIGDGHVELDWPEPAPVTASPPPSDRPPDACEQMGFAGGRITPGVGPQLPTFKSVGDPAIFPAGLVTAGQRTIGVIRIAEFDPHSAPDLCPAALRLLHRPQDKPCDNGCADALLGVVYDDYTRRFEAQLAALKAAGATTLLVDLTGNGGGSEWAEAAARMVSAVPLTSEPLGFVRGTHWARQWHDLAGQLRAAAKHASAADRRHLLAWVTQAEQAEAAANQPCAAATPCDLVARAGYATGLVGTAPAGAFAGKPWGVLVFSPAQFPYHDGAWLGPLAVLVDDETWSAAEEFAAVLQDNDAAVIAGTRTGGAGCGHTAGGTPVTLSHSGAVLQMPDCARFRHDGGNEVSGVIPDVLIGLRYRDGAALKARLVASRLEEVAAQAERQLATRTAIRR